MNQLPTLHRIRTRNYNSRRNFGEQVGRKRGESNFLRGFERAYFADAGGGIFANEFAQPQMGVADMVWVAWTNEKKDGGFTALCVEKILRRKSLVAFEAKLKDWQQALRQAYRYRYFSNQSIVVMPVETAKAAERNLSVFQEMGVGLWTFDKPSESIYKHYTHVRTRALNREAHQKAIVQISTQVDLRKLSK